MQIPSLLLPLHNYKTKDNLDTQGGNEGGELSQECVGVGWQRGREPTGEFWSGTVGTNTPVGFPIQKALGKVEIGTKSRFISQRCLRKYGVGAPEDSPTPGRKAVIYYQ